MKIDRHKFLAIALSMGLGNTVAGCFVHVEEHPNGQAQEPQTAGRRQWRIHRRAGECGPQNIVVGGEVNQTAAPADECVEWDPSGECIGWAGQACRRCPRERVRPVGPLGGVHRLGAGRRRAGR